MVDLDPNAKHPLFFDPAYYNPLEEKRKDAMRDNWDPDMVGVGVVNVREDGTWAGIDFMHRSTAARELGIPALPAVKFEGLGVAEEAHMHRFLNSRKHRRLPTARQEFRPSIIEGDRNAIELLRILNAHEYKIEGRGDNFIAGFGLVQRAYGLDEGVSLDKALKASREAWPTGQISGIWAYTLSVIFFKCRPAYKTLVHVLRHMTPDLSKTPAPVAPSDWVITVRRGQYVGVNTRYMPFLLVKEFLTRYNKGKSANALSLSVLDHKNLLSCPPTR